MSQRALPSILVVEDDLDLRQTIVAGLEANGFAAAQAADAADAIERLRSFAYDGLVVDLRLPDADGMDSPRRSARRYPEIRAVVITGFGGVDEAVTAIKRGAIDFLIKPFQLSQLVARAARPGSSSSDCARRTPSCRRSSKASSASTTSSAATARCRRSSRRSSSWRR